MTDNVKIIIIELIDEYNRTNYKLDLIQRDINTLKQSLGKVSKVLEDDSIMNSQEIFEANINDIEKKLVILEDDKKVTVEHLETLRNRENTLMEHLKSQPGFNIEKFKTEVQSLLTESQNEKK